MDRFPILVDILNGHYDYANEPTGEVSLNAADFEAFQKLCKVTDTKIKTPPKELGGNAAIVAVADLAAAVKKATGKSLTIMVENKPAIAG